MSDRPEPQPESIVLIVDDKKEIRRVLKRILTDKDIGYRGEIKEAADGDEALELLRQFGNRIRLVITDFNMPGASGKEVAELAHATGIQAIAVITGISGNLKSITVPVFGMEKPLELQTIKAWLKQQLFPADQKVSTG